MAKKFSQSLFWLPWAKKVALDPFWWIFVTAIVLWVPFLRVWWWLILPILLSAQLRILYFWWIRWDFAYAKYKWVVLEIIPPKEVLMPVKAMEDVFTIIWTINDGATWRELYFEGELDNTPYWMSFEIVSIEGNIHFFARILKQHRSTIEAALYAHYPEIEIQEVPDYAKQVPLNMPNEEWDVSGEDYVLMRPSAYPIKTYEKFFEPEGQKISAEEKRIDPMFSLLESLSVLGPGEQFWVQFILHPLLDKDDDWLKKAEEIRDKIANRTEKKETSLWDEIMQIGHDLILGPEKEGSGESAKYKWTSPQVEESGEREMVITPGEREIITEIENKMKKPSFRANLRGVYIAKRENWNPSNKTIARAYFSHFQTKNMNWLQFSNETRPKVHYVFRQRRAFFRARKLFRNAVLRFTPLFPDRRSVCAILNTEEMASIFHFPIKISGLSAPAMGRIESKKAGPPPNLPTE